MVDACFKDYFFDMDEKVGARNILLKVVDEMSRASGDTGDLAETAGASADAPSQENDRKASPSKQARIKTAGRVPTNPRGE